MHTISQKKQATSHFLLKQLDQAFDKYIWRCGCIRINALQPFTLYMQFKARMMSRTSNVCYFRIGGRFTLQATLTTVRASWMQSWVKRERTFQIIYYLVLYEVSIKIKGRHWVFVINRIIRVSYKGITATLPCCYRYVFLIILKLYP